MSRASRRRRHTEVSLAAELCDPAAVIRQTMLRMGLVVGALALPAMWSGTACSPVARVFEGTGGHTSGSGGSGGTMGGACTPGDMKPCYTGPASTMDVGICKHGLAKCGADGKPGACMGETLPAMKVDCAAHQDQDCDGKIEHCPIDYLWARSYGLAGNNNLVRGLAADTSGNVVACGMMTGKVDFGKGALATATGDADVFVVKLDAQGNTLWQGQYGDPTYDQECDAAGFDAQGNVYFAGGYEATMDVGPQVLPMSAGQRDAYVVKLDPSGAPTWARTGGDTNNQLVETLAVTADGGVVVAGNYNGTFNFNGGGPVFPGSATTQNLFVQRFDAGGASVFGVASANSAPDGGSTYLDVYGVTTDVKDNVILTGAFQGSLTVGGKTAVSAGGSDVFVMKLDGKSGAVVWLQSFGSPGDDQASGMAADKLGDVVVSGSFTKSMALGTFTVTSPGRGLFLARIQPDGTVSWANGYGNGSVYDIMFVHVDDKNDLVLGGVFDGTVDFGGGALASAPMGQMGAAAFVAKLDASGKHLASKAFAPMMAPDGGMGGPIAIGLAVTTVPVTNEIVLGGTTFTTTDFGGGPIGPSLASSPFVAEYAP